MVILLFTKLLKYDLKTASGNAKAALLASTVAASASYILAGKGSLDGGSSRVCVRNPGRICGSRNGNQKGGSVYPPHDASDRGRLLICQDGSRYGHGGV